MGSTKLQLKIRILQHMRAITNNDFNYPMARHFEEHHGSDCNTLKFWGIDRVMPHPRGEDRERKLRVMEPKYIIELHTKAPMGLNSGEELATHIGYK